MLRKFVCAVAILGFTIGLTVAGEMKGKITKVDGNKITFSEYNKETKKLGDAQVLDATGAKVSKMDKKNKVEVTEGLKAADLSTIGEKGVSATVITDDTSKKVTEIILGGGKKKKE